MNWNLLNKLLLGALVLSLSLGQLTRISLPLGGAVYAHDVVVIGWMVLLLSRFGVNRLLLSLSEVKKKYLLEGLLLVWIGLGWVSALVVNSFDPTTLLYAGRLTAYLTWAYLAYHSSHLRAQEVLLGFSSTGVLILFFGVLQYILVPDTRFLAILGWDDHYYRLISTLFDPNFTGLLLVLTILYLEKAKVKIKNWQTEIATLLQALLVIGVMLTFSRSSYLALGISMVGLMATQWKNKIWPILGMIMLGLITLVVAPKPGGEGVKLLRTASTVARVESSQQTVETDWRALIIGEGLFQPQRSAVSTNGYQRANTARFADNLLVFLYNGMGIIGLGMSLLLLGKWGRVLYYRDTLLLIALASTLAHSLFNNTFFQPLVTLFLLGGVLASALSYRALKIKA